MSLIRCTQNCIYQNDGYCTLESTGKNQKATPNDYCVDFTPRLQSTVKQEPPEPGGYF